MKKSVISAALIGGLVVAGSGTGFAQQAKAAAPSRVVNLAEQGIGEKYVWGANDCSGFTQKVFGKLGISLPHSSAAQAGYGTPVSKSNLQPGDLVFFNISGAGISHVGIYVGNDRMISAENEKTGVREAQIFHGGASGYWAQKYVTARRIVPSQQSPRHTVKSAAASTSVSAKANTSYRPAASIKSAAKPSKAQNATTYTIQSGDTLSEISLKVNVPVAQLKAINGLSSDHINAGQVLKLKGQAVQAAKAQPATAAKSTASTVKSASSQSTPKAAAKVKPASSQSTPKAAAKVKPASSQSTPKGAATKATKATAQAKATAAQTVSRSASKAVHGTYVVNAGDSLWAISRDNGISVAQIKKANHLNSDTIYTGQKLKVTHPAKASKKKYTIKKGDTLWDIAVAHKTTVFKLVEANHIQSTMIFPNQQLVIPDK